MDLFIFYSINNLAGHWRILDLFFVFLAKYLIYLILISLGIYWLKTDWPTRKMIIFSFLAVLLGLVFNGLIFLFYFRPRPFISHQVNLLLPHSPDSSFPSDHATFVFALAWFFFFFKKRIWSGLLFLGFLLGFSRIYVGLHYPSDIIASFLVGFLAGWVIYQLIRFFQNKKAGFRRPKLLLPFKQREPGIEDFDCNNRIRVHFFFKKSNFYFFRKNAGQRF